ncbi:hypothetical protein BDF19DRAFT_467656 [Syncephalis fuscata]|nr:hypothetical protein BDF19DRAFT_467656 [Syncephalis fuscata]
MADIDKEPDINSFEYWANRGDHSIAAIQARSIGVHIQLVICVVLIWAFARNVYRVSSNLLKSNVKLASWCCLASSLSGLISFGIVSILHHLPGGPSCRALIACCTLGMALSNFAINAILLERAYIVRQRSRWILVIGIILNAIQLITYGLIFFVELKYEYRPSVGCYVKFPLYGPYTRFLVDTPPVLVPSIVFIMSIYQQFRRFKSGCWRRLMKNGIITMMLVIISNLLFAVLLITDVLDDLSMVLYPFDWIITSTILVENTIRIYSSGQVSSNSTETRQKAAEQAISAPLSLELLTGGITTHMPSHII